VNGKNTPLHWKFKSHSGPKGKQGQPAEEIFVFENENPALELKSIWTAYSGPGPIEHQIKIRNKGDVAVMLPLQPSIVLDARGKSLSSEDFAKQLLVLLGTLMTAITSFYLGAGTVTSAVKAGSDAAGTLAASSPTLSGIKPPSHSLASGTPLLLEINGANLNDIKHVKIAKEGAVPISGANVKSSPTGIVCELDVSNATAGTWDIEVDDGGPKSAKLPGALTITA